ncbi:MAG: vWA domain-containing protein [Pirellulales bacterium]
MSIVGRAVSKIMNVGVRDTAAAARRRRVAAAVCCALTVWLGIVTVRWILWAPHRTPLLVLSATYDAPWDINPWVGENLAWLQSLDHRNVTVHSLGNGDDAVRGNWADLEEDVRRSADAASADLPLIIYIGLHGVTDEAGRAYLVVHDSTVDDASSWLGWDELLDRLQKCIEPGRHWMVLLESGRQGMSAPLVTQRHRFAETVTSQLDARRDDARFQNLTVMIASDSSRLPTVDSAAGHGDCFTRAVAEGLSGKADERRWGGNADRSVSTQELAAYVKARTEELARLHRGCAQQPIVWNGDRAASRAAWSLRTPISTVTTDWSPPTTQQIQELESIWQRVGETIAEHRLWHDQPGRCAEWERRAAALESAAFGGEAVRDRFSDWSQSLKQEIAQVEQQLRSDRNRSRTLDTVLLAAHIEDWKAFAANPTATTLSRLKSTSANQEKLPLPLCEPFLATLAVTPGIDFERMQPYLQQLAEIRIDQLQTRHTAEEAALLPAASWRGAELENWSRRIEDMFLCEAAPSSIEMELDALRAQTTVWAEACQAWQELSVTASKSWSLLPHLSDTVDAAIGSSSASSVESHGSDRQLAARWKSITASLMHNQQALEAEWNRSPEPTVHLKQTVRSAAPIDFRAELSSFIDDCISVWNKADVDPVHAGTSWAAATDKLLRTAWLPRQQGSAEQAATLRTSLREHLIAFDLHLERDRATSTGSGSHAAQHNTDSNSRSETRGRLMQLSSELTAAGSDRDSADLRSASAWTRTARSAAAARLRTAITGRASDAAATTGYQNGLDHRRTLDTAASVLDAFWALPSQNDQPWFDSAAGALIDSLKPEPSIGAREPTDINHEVSRLRLILAERRAAAALGIRLVAECAPQIDPADPLQTHCTVAPGPEAHGLPAGIASLRMLTESKSGCVPVAVGPSMTMQRGDVPLVGSTTLVGNRPQAEAIVQFRGHVYRYPFDLRPELRRGSAAELSMPGSATITIDDARPRRRARIFILDCSASMAQTERTEGVQAASTGKADGLQTDKLSTAKLALVEMLSRLRGGPDAVGVMFYGHRAAAGRPEQGILLQHRYFADHPFPQSLQPYDDVETILAPGRFDDAQWSTVIDHIEDIVPWGQTPLYVALMQAVEHAQRLGRDVHCDVIVISDGRNYQFNPPADRRVAIEQVIEAARSADVAIHTIGFGVPSAEAAEATTQYQLLAEATGGSSTLQAADGTTLLENLQTLTQPEPFTVRLPSGETLVGHTHEPLRLSGSVPDNTAVEIEYRQDRKRIPISSRSAVELTTGGDGRLICVDYRGGPRTQAPILKFDGRSSPFVASVYRPQSYGDALKWQVGLSRVDAEVPQRSKHVLMQISPLRSEGRDSHGQDGEAYCLADAAWMSDTPQPVLQFETLDWPRTADAARVELFISDEAPKLLRSVPIDTMVANLVSSNSRSREQRLDIDRGTDDRFDIQIRMRPEQVTVVLLHDKSDTVMKCAPELIGLDVRHVRRYFSQEGRMSVHRFGLNANAVAATSNNIDGHPSPTLEIRDLAEYRSLAMRLAEPLIVPLSNSAQTAGVSSPPEIVR